jgi:hypothetical protein
MSDKILSLLGVDDELSAVRAIETANQFLNEVKTATGRDTFAESLAVIKTCVTFEREIRAIATKEGADKQASAAEAIGTFLGWKSSHETLPGVREELEKAKENVRVTDVKRLIALGLEAVRTGCNDYAGKLTPATAKHFENKTAEELEAYLKVAPRVMPGERTAPPVENTTTSFKTNERGRITDSSGRTYEEILPVERSEMNRNDPDLYKAMREDWNNHGRPAGILEISDEDMSKPITQTFLKPRG